MYANKRRCAQRLRDLGILLVYFRRSNVPRNEHGAYGPDVNGASEVSSSPNVRAFLHLDGTREICAMKPTTYI